MIFYIAQSGQKEKFCQSPRLSHTQGMEVDEGSVKILAF